MVGVLVLQAEMVAAMTNPGGTRANPVCAEPPPNQLLSIMAAPPTGAAISNIHKLAALARHAAGHHLIGRHRMTPSTQFLYLAARVKHSTQAEVEHRL